MALSRMIGGGYDDYTDGNFRPLFDADAGALPTLPSSAK